MVTRGIDLTSGMRGELVRGVGASFILRIIGAALSLAVSVTLARVLGPEGYGVYAFCLAVVSMMAIPAQFGVGTVMVRFCAAYEKQRDWGLLKGLLQWGNRFVLISSVILAASAGLVLAISPGLVPPQSNETLWWALLLLPVLALGELRAAALRGFRRFVTGQLPETLLRPGGLLLIVGTLIALSLKPDLDATDAMLAYIAASILAFFLGTWWLLRAIPISVKKASASRDLITWRKAMSILSLTRGGRVALGRMDIIFVGSLVGAEAAGIYRVASALAGLIGFGVGAVNNVIGPYFSRLHVSGQRQRIRRLLLLACGALALLSILIALALVFFGENLIRIVYGSSFSAAWIPLLILSVGQLINGMTGPVGILTNMTGQERWTLLAIISALVMVVPAYLILVPWLGAIGGAVAMTGSLMILNGVLSARIWLWMRSSEL